MREDTATKLAIWSMGISVLAIVISMSSCPVAYGQTLAPFPGAVEVNGGWVPCSHPIAIAAGRGCGTVPSPTATTTQSQPVGVDWALLRREFHAWLQAEGYVAENGVARQGVYSQIAVLWVQFLAERNIVPPPVVKPPPDPAQPWTLHPDEPMYPGRYYRDPYNLVVKALGVLFLDTHGWQLLAEVVSGPGTKGSILMFAPDRPRGVWWEVTR